MRRLADSQKRKTGTAGLISDAFHRIEEFFARTVPGNIGLRKKKQGRRCNSLSWPSEPCLAVVLTPKPAPAQGRDMTRVSDKFYARQLSYCYDTEVC